jgi:hypothetical protein
VKPDTVIGWHRAGRDGKAAVGKGQAVSVGVAGRETERTVGTTGNGLEDQTGRLISAAEFLT